MHIEKKFSVDKNIIWVIEGTDYIKISCELRVIVCYLCSFNILCCGICTWFIFVFSRSVVNGIQNRRQIGICSKLQNNQNRLVSGFEIDILVTMTEADLRNALDMTVDKIMNKLARKPFLDAFPEVGKL